MTDRCFIEISSFSLVIPFFQFYFIFCCPSSLKEDLESCLVSDPPGGLRLGPPQFHFYFFTRSTILIRLPPFAFFPSRGGSWDESCCWRWPQSVRTGCCTLSWNSSTFFFSSFIEYYSRWKDQNEESLENCVSGVMDRKNSSQASVNSSERNKWMIEVTMAAINNCAR